MSNSKVCESYKVPEWAEKPQHNFNIDVLKNGVIISNIDLTKQDHYIFGRKEPMCDIVLEHPSISRQHAVIQFGKNDTVALIDLGSTHGTKVNKQSIPKGKFHTLHVGDVIKFAESTRLYVLNGPEELKPEEYDSENLRKFRSQAKEREKQRQKEFEELKKKGLEDEEARKELTKIKKSLTGTDEDVIKNLSKYKKVYHINDENDEEIEEADGNNTTTEGGKDKVNQDLLTKQQQELYQRLEQFEKRKEKLEERIAMLNKQSEFGFEDISDRQKRSIEKDEKMLETLQEQIAKVQEEIEKLNDEEKTTQKDEISSEYYNDEFDDEDEYFDRTLKEKKKKQKMNEDKEVLNEKTVSIKLKDLNKEIITIKRKIKEIDLEEQIAVNTISNNGNNNNINQSNSFDPLDMYMSTNVCKLHQNEKKKLEIQLNEIIKQQDKYYKMLKVIITTVDFSNNNDNDNNDNIEDEVIPKEVLKETEKLKENLNNPNFMVIMNNSNNNNNNNNTSFKMKPPPSQPSSSSSSSSSLPPKPQQQPKIQSFKMKMPPPAFKDSDLKSDNNDDNNSKLMPPPPSLPKPSKSSTKTATTKPNATKRLANPVLQGLSEKEKEEENQKKKKKIEIDEENWKPPEDQSGDGKTALNDLLGY